MPKYTQKRGEHVTDLLAPRPRQYGQRETRSTTSARSAPGAERARARRRKLGITSEAFGRNWEGMGASESPDTGKCRKISVQDPNLRAAALYVGSIGFITRTFPTGNTTSIHSSLIRFPVSGEEKKGRIQEHISCREPSYMVKPPSPITDYLARLHASGSATPYCITGMEGTIPKRSIDLLGIKMSKEKPDRRSGDEDEDGKRGNTVARVLYSDPDEIYPKKKETPLLGLQRQHPVRSRYKPECEPDRATPKLFHIARPRAFSRGHRDPRSMSTHAVRQAEYHTSQNPRDGNQSSSAPAAEAGSGAPRWSTVDDLVLERAVSRARMGLLVRVAT
ncbi:hypothetical protein EDB89DRAFT_1902080 [Lactarius sanguifluus]|nr:hypothetical protein EDB89DRAFT_1902080 [Lactarius sanguifluus]